MNRLLEPAVKLMNRLQYGYKFGIIGLLIVVQASVLIYMLVSELDKNIHFTAQERLGIRYVQSLAGLLNEAQSYRSLHYAFSLGDHSLKEALTEKQGKVEAALDAVEETDRLMGGQLDTTWRMQMLRQDWLARKQETFQFEPGRAQVAFELDGRWINEIADLMQYTGYSSNLAMDIDFDTSYLIDSVLRKLPGLMDTLGMAQGLAVQLSDAEELSAENRSRLLQVAGLMRSQLEQTDRNTQLVFRHNDDIRAKLAKTSTALTDSVPIFAWNFEQKMVGQQGIPIPQQLLNAGGSQAIQNTWALYREELDVIDGLLALRIDKYSRDRNAVLIFTGGILLIVCYLFLAFDMSVRKGVYQLNGLMESAGKGELNVRGDIYSRDEMGSLTHSINSMLDSLQKMYEEVRLSHKRLELWNQELEHKVAERTAALRNLLDHAGQGFLSFGEDLQVTGEYSAECKTIFKRDIAGTSVPDLIYPEDMGQQAFLGAIFKKVFEEQDEFLRETYLSLLPTEIILGDRYIAVAYKILDKTAETDRREIMLILTDRTIQKEMEDYMQTEKNILAMVVHVVTNSVDFFAAVRQYTGFCQAGMAELLAENRPAGDILASLFRIIHTFKGTFGQMKIYNVMARLHEMEERLDSIRSEKLPELKREYLADRLSSFTPAVMLGLLEKDLNILKDTLGESFFLQENMLVVDNARLLEIEDKVQRTLSSGECGMLLPDLRRLRYKPVKELLQSYPEYVCGLAERNEKAVKPFEIEGGETLVDPLIYYDFFNSLGHVFRNSIVHGLESFDERLQNGKEELGVVTCSAEEQGGELVVTITDDGRGIDAARIRDIAVKKSICDKETAGKMTDKQAIQLIFSDGFFGAQSVSELAGRGVGLSAVRSELEKLGGSVHVDSAVGQGTQFRFSLPLIQLDQSEPYSIRQLAKPLLAAAEEILTTAELEVKGRIYLDGLAGRKLNLRKFTTFIGVKGLATGRLVLSADQEIIEYLIAKPFGTKETEETESKKMENILAQYAHEIFQRAVTQLPHWADSVTTEALVTILAEDASAQYPQAEMPTWELETNLGCITLSLIY
jgi:signal transduction histidine kinase